MEKPLLAITMGDPAGIGPEVIAAAWRDAVAEDAYGAVVVGNPTVLRILLQEKSKVNKHASNRWKIQIKLRKNSG